MITVTVPTPDGDIGLKIQFDEQHIILSAQEIATTHQQPVDVLAWLAQWLPGRDIVEAQGLGGEAVLRANPTWGLPQARLVDALMKDALYQTHRKVEITGVIVCKCKKVTREMLLSAINSDPLMTRETLTQQTSAGSGCGQCLGDLTKLLEESRPGGRRWQGKPNSHWVLEIENSLSYWLKRHDQWPSLTVGKFQEGLVRVKVAGPLSADQEWELVDQLAAYWADGFPEPLAVSLDF